MAAPGSIITLKLIKEVTSRWCRAGKSMYRKQITNLLTAIMQSNDPHQERLLVQVQNMIDQAGAYVKTVMMMESRIEILRFRMEPEDYRIAVAQLDSRRKSMHDALISMVNMVNRFCDNFEQEKIYQGDNDRISIAQFAFDLAKEFKPVDPLTVKQKIMAQREVDETILRDRLKR